MKPPNPGKGAAQRRRAGKKAAATVRARTPRLTDAAFRRAMDTFIASKMVPAGRER